MKAILMSIKPKWVAKILNGEKTIEIRKTKPNVDLPIDVYIYMTKNGGELFNGLYTAPDMNGRVIAKFTMNKCQEWHNYSWQEITEKGCITDEELRAYCKDRKSLYIWHIDNLVIFDKPKELSEFKPYCDKDGCSSKCCYEHCKYYFEDCDGETTYKSCSIAEGTVKLTKAPQSFTYVEVEE